MSCAVCPYCGKEMFLHFAKNDEKTFWFECKNCYARSPLETSEENAVRRAGYLVSDSEINELKKIVSELKTQVVNQAFLKADNARLKFENDAIRSVTNSTVHTLGVLLRGCDRCREDDD